ncbi:MAG: hypothetical protein V3U92_02130 [Cellulophaga sp.]
MAKKTNEKQTKQELVNTSFSFTNVPKVGEKNVLSGSPDGDTDNTDSLVNDVSSIVKIQFNIHPDYVKKFHRLKGEYALANDSFNFFVDKMFCCGVAFLKDNFEKNKMYEKPNNEFLKRVLRAGKRKKNNRSLPIKDSDQVFVKIDSKYSDDYNALIFSYMLKYDKESIADDKYSRTYFFYDFIDLLEKNKKTFLKFDFKGN